MKLEKNKILSKVENITSDTKKLTVDISTKTKDLITSTKDNIASKLDRNTDGKIITEEDIIKILDSLYNNAINGLGKVSPSIEDFAKDYLDKEKNASIAAKNMINNQVIKCTTSGFITGFGGLITLPVTIPANISSVLYVQMRMIATVAYMAGYDLKQDQVQTLVYACLAGISITEIVKQTGIKIGTKMAKSAITRIPGKTLTKINQKVGFRFITKFGEKGVINLGKLVPGVGAVISGSIDYTETKVIGNRAYKWFFEGNFESNELKNKEIGITK